MAKLIPPPQINHLDEIIDVLVHQDKYLEYMKQMQAMRDGIVELLGVVDTQDKADQKLQEAQVKHAEALDIIHDAQEEAKGMAVEMQRRQAALDQREQKLALYEDQTRKQLDQDRHSIAAQQAELDQQTKDQVRREALLAAKEQTLIALSKVLDEREAKANKLKQALGEAGI